MSTSSEPRRFGVKLLFHSSIDGQPEHEPLFEVSIRLIRAVDEENAKQVAEAVGRGAQHHYENGDGEVVRWHFSKVMDVFEIVDDFSEQGAEVYGYVRHVSDSWR